MEKSQKINTGRNMSSTIYQYGLHAVQSLLDHQPERVKCLWVLQARHDEKLMQILQLAKQQNIRIEKIGRDALDQKVKNANHQGIIAECMPVKSYSEHELPQLLERIEGVPFILVLDGVQDPQNLGACFRTADAAGVHCIIAPKDKAVGLTATVSKVACGAAETVPFVQVTNLARFLELLKEKGIWVYGAAGEADQSIYQCNLKGPVAIVLGAEGQGLRRLTRENCDALIRIPMNGSVSSLNVSVATGVILFEVVRQNLKSKA